jgi:RraA family protein
MANKPKSAEIHPGPGFRVSKKVVRPPAELIAEVGRFETPDISDLMNRLYAMDHAIHNVVNDRSILGPACTVKVFPGDNLMVHKALDIARPGDVVVVDASTSTNNAVIGDLVSAKAKHRGIAAFVIDGLVRDLPVLQEVGLPIYARGVTAVGPLHRGPGEINFPVSCGGIVVNPGDIIVGDRCGVVVVRHDFAVDILDRLNKQREAMEAYVADVRRGEFSNAWVDKQLLEANCPFIE